MRNKINQVTIFLLLIFGFFFPTSIKGVISLNLSVMHSIILIFLLTILLFINKKQKTTFWLSFSVICILMFFTLMQLFFTNPILEKISWGSFLPFIALVVLFSTSYTAIKSTKTLNITFLLINIVLIAMGILTIFDDQTISTFIYNNYSMGYAQLSTNMLAFDKPVNMFGSHSIASLFYYLFFYINFKKFEFTKNKIILILGILNLPLIFSLKSVSAYILLFIAIFQILLFLFMRYRIRFLISIPFIAIFAFYIFHMMQDNLIYSFSLKDNGFLGRYSSDSVLTSNFDYLQAHMLPIGLWISDSLYFTDSGFVVNYLKGSIFLVLAIYLSLFLFFRSNIIHKRTAMILFLIFLIFELGYPILTYTRMLYFLPFVVIYISDFTSPALNKKD